ncbi:MAG: hypothetical protein LBC85_04115 [Fibromonadaceae bacterium]|jgi:hypothetical protein|nr:hypothetical protein [Fibromonadaceae bacterium]
MKTATIERTQTKISRASAPRVKTRPQTFQEWLIEEAAAGRIIGPKNIKPTVKPERPEPGPDWWSAYEYSRADRF